MLAMTAAFFLRKTSGIFLLNKFLAQNRRTGAKSATVAEFEFETKTFSQHSIFQILWSCLSAGLPVWLAVWRTRASELFVMAIFLKSISKFSNKQFS